MNEARLLVDALRDPETTATLDGAGWTALLAMARAEQLIGTLGHRLDGRTMPVAARRILEDACAAARQGRIAALWEAEMARRALAPLGVPVVLLKGTAFVAAGLKAGVGRSIGDLDILVPQEALPDVEAALLGAGWEWVKEDTYDDSYYRRWMHELPPLIHRERDRMIDVHHTILPPTARPKPDAAALLAESIELNNGVRVLSPEHMVIHAAAHLIADGDLSGGLRNLWDIDCLCREFGEQQTDFYLSLFEEARVQGLWTETRRALRLAHQLFGTPVVGYRSPIRVDLRAVRSDAFYRRRLLARDDWGRPVRRATRFAFFVRSHWLRMPPTLLARHLFTKWRKGHRG